MASLAFQCFTIFGKIVKIAKIATLLGDLPSLAFQSFAIFADKRDMVRKTSLWERFGDPCPRIQTKARNDAASSSRALEKITRMQKHLYDIRSSRSWRQSLGFTAWQGPYRVTKVLNDGLNYELDTGKAHKQHRKYHMNFLSWSFHEIEV